MSDIVRSAPPQRDDEQPPARPAPTVNLASALPDMLALIPAEDRQLAARAMAMPLVTACDEDLARGMETQRPSAFTFLIVDGVVLKHTTLKGRSALELLGPGDVLAPPLTAIRQLESRALSRYVAHGPVSLAAIEGHFHLAARRWPVLTDYLHDCMSRQAHRASMHIAMLHLPRIEDRLTALFADLAERFGHVTSDGILINLPLTHELIGGLVGSRRPTATLALNKLAADGVLERLAHDRWKVAKRVVSI